MKMLLVVAVALIVWCVGTTTPASANNQIHIRNSLQTRVRVLLHYRGDPAFKEFISAGGAQSYDVVYRGAPLTLVEVHKETSKNYWATFCGFVNNGSQLRLGMSVDVVPGGPKGCELRR